MPALREQECGAGSGRVLCGDIEEKLVDSCWATQPLLDRIGSLLRFHEAGSDSCRLFISSESLDSPSRLLQSVAKRQVALCGGLQFDGAGKVGDRFGKFPLLPRQQAKTQPGIKLVGVVFERLLVVRLRTLVIA